MDYDGLDSNWSLQENSGCINLGDPMMSTDSIGVELDLAGKSRIFQGGGSQIVDIGAYEFQGIPTGLDDIKILPMEVRLKQNYPNPFNPQTVISYNVSNKGDVLLSVYDITGREIATLVDKPQNPGSYSILFDASQLSSGTYIYRLKLNGLIKSRKMLLLQ